MVTPHVMLTIRTPFFYQANESHGLELKSVLDISIVHDEGCCSKYILD